MDFGDPKVPEPQSAEQKALGQALVRFLHPTDDVKNYLEQTILPVLTPSLERLLRTASEHGAIKAPDQKGEGDKDADGDAPPRVGRRGTQEGDEPKRGRRASLTNQKTRRLSKEPEVKKQEFSALLWLSDHLRQFSDPPGQTKYRERFDARRTAMREYLLSLVGVSSLELLDRPPQLDLDLEEPKADAEVEEAVALLRSVPGALIASLPSGAVDKVVSAVSFADFEEGQVITDQGQNVTHVFFVCEGEVEVDVKPGVNASDTDDLTVALLKRSYTRGHWWPVESVLDTPYLSTTRAFNKVRVARLPVDFFRALVLPASLQARNILFSEVYNSPALQAVPRFARALFCLECVELATAEDEGALHPDAAAAVVIVDGHAGGPSGDTFKAGDLVGKLFDEESWGPINGAPSCKAYVAPRAELQRVLVDPVAPESRSRLQSLA